MPLFTGRYLCRSCNEYFHQSPLHEAEPLTLLTQMLQRDPEPTSPYKMLIPHDCNDGNYGVADFVGLSG